MSNLTIGIKTIRGRRNPVPPIFFAAFLAAGLAGCGEGSNTLAPVTVTGTVKWQGKPLSGASVFFVPEKGPRATGETDATGRFRLMTYRAGDGAVPGDFKVGISKFVVDPATANDPVPASKNEVPDHYSNPATSTLTATVVAGKTNDFPFELKE